jgi:hypothetical protein
MLLPYRVHTHNFNHHGTLRERSAKQQVLQGRKEGTLLRWSKARAWEGMSEDEGFYPCAVGKVPDTGDEFIQWELDLRGRGENRVQPAWIVGPREWVNCSTALHSEAPGPTWSINPAGPPLFPFYIRDMPKSSLVLLPAPQKQVSSPASLIPSNRNFINWGIFKRSDTLDRAYSTGCPLFKN